MHLTRLNCLEEVLQASAARRGPQTLQPDQIVALQANLVALALIVADLDATTPMPLVTYAQFMDRLGHLMRGTGMTTNEGAAAMRAGMTDLRTAP